MVVTLATSACNQEQGASAPAPALETVSSALDNANSTNKVLILGSSVAGGLASREAQAVASASPSTQIDVVTPEQWKDMTAQQFMEYRALIIGDAACQSGPAAFQAAVESRKQWGIIVDGDVALFATDPTNNETPELVENGIRYVLNSVQKRTGMYIALGCAYQHAPTPTPVTLLEPFGTFEVQGVPGCADSGHMFGMWNDLISRDLWDGLLTGNGCAARSVFTRYPDHDFSFAAIAMSSTATPIPGQRTYVDFLYEPEQETPFVGTPYLLVRGAEPQSAGCGLPETSPDETCDLGDALNGMPAVRGQQPGSTCSFSCHLHWCGDGFVDASQGEECDLGINNGRTGDARGEIGACTSFCRLPYRPPPPQPPHALCKDVTTFAETTCGVSASIDDGSYDPDGLLVGCTQTPASPYPIGTSTVTLTCVDQQGLSSSCTGEVRVLDRVVPTLVLHGSTAPSLECTQGGAYFDPGASANDLCDGPLEVERTGSVRAGVPARYPLHYKVTDAAGNSPAPKHRTVDVSDTLPPRINLNGLSQVALECGTHYTDPGATAMDLCSGDLTQALLRSGTVNPLAPGSYPLRYTVRDAAGHNAEPVNRLVTVADTLPPSITLNGPLHLQVECGAPGYEDPGATALDVCAGVLPAVPGSRANPNVPGSYTLRYSATDPSGNTAISAEERTVTVSDTLPPSLVLLGSATEGVECGTPYSDPGATAQDMCAGDLTDSIMTSGSVDIQTPGAYPLTYSVADGAGHSLSLLRTVTVTDTLSPSLVLLGPALQQLECGTPYSDPGATAQDTCAGDLTDSIMTSGSVDIQTPGTYPLTYSVADGAGHEISLLRTVTVSDTLPPSLVLLGPALQQLECGTHYSDPGATAQDMCAGDLADSIVTSGSVDIQTPGAYPLTYSVADGAGHSLSLLRTVTVRDTRPPLVTLTGPRDVRLECGDDAYTDPGATASDACAGALPAVPGAVANPDVPGSYSIPYSATDPSGNTGTSDTLRTVTVTDTLPPSLVLQGPAFQQLECGTPYDDPGATAQDVCAGDLTGSIVRTGAVDPRVPGSYTLGYSVADPSGHGSSVHRVVDIRDTLAPSIALKGPLALSFECGSNYVDPGAEAMDACAGDVSARILVTGAVNPGTEGTYTLSYSVTDPSGNLATAATGRTVTVTDTLAPALSINGPAHLTLECGSPYSDPGATAIDACAGDLTFHIVRSGSVDTSAPGSYAVHYSVSDPSGLTAELDRAVTVVDTQAPHISCPAPIVTEVLEASEATVTPGAAHATDTCDVAVPVSHPSQTRFPLGTTVLTYTATDGSGNTASCTSTITVLLILLPDTYIVSGPPEETKDTHARFEFAASKPQVTFECSLEGSDFEECSQSTAFHGLSEGPHQLLVRARDSLGNVDPTPASGTWTVVPLPIDWDRAVLGGGHGCASAGGNPLVTGLLGLVLALLGRSRRLPRRSPRTRMRLLGLAVPLLGATTSAQPQRLPAFEMERLSLNPSATGSLLLGTGELLPDGAYRLALTGHYENNPLVLVQDGQHLGAVVRYRATAHVSAAYGVQDKLEFGVQVPLLLRQRGDDLSARGLISPEGGPAMGTPMLTLRWKLLSERHEDPVDLSVGVQAGPELGRAEALARELRAIPSIMVGRRQGLLRAALDAGVLLRPRTILTPDANVQDELGYALRLGGVLATTGEGLRAETAVIAALPLRREGSSLEALAGLRVPLSASLEAYGLAGLGYGTAPGTPDFRLLLGMAYVRTPPVCIAGGRHTLEECPHLDDDEDGVSNGDDACPRQGGRVDEKGCPPEDSDSDGLEDRVDLCPLEPGLARFQGCPDQDLDGLQDTIDRCPNEPGPADHLGCPPKDSDEDGLLDEQDACPTVTGLPELNGCPPKDTDGDALPDDLDNCPCQPGPQDNEGCPETEKQLVGLRHDHISIKEAIHFEFNKAVIQPRSYPLLDQVARVLQEHPNLTSVSIEGHTDDKGPDAYNLNLSQRRAEAVREYLASKGVARERLEARGFGESRPVQSNATPEGRAANRRVEFMTRSADELP